MPNRLDADARKADLEPDWHLQERWGHPPRTVKPDAAAIIQKLSCGRGICACAQSVRRGQGLVHCPSHIDPGPSLNVTPSDTAGALVKCHGGCPQGAVVAELRTLGVWPDSTAQPVAPRPSPARVVPVRQEPNVPETAPRVVATYDYRDGETIRFQVVRYEPKGFKQRRPDGRGGWLWGLTDETPRILYRLNDLRAGVAAGKRIWVVEGEKDADAGAALGLVTTTSPMGAGKWRDEFAIEFVNADVVIIRDNDIPDPKTGRRPGTLHADKIAESLDLAAKSVRILELPEAHDLSDWLTRNPPDIVALNALADVVPEYRSPTSAKLLTASDRAARYWDVLDARQRGDENVIGWQTGISFLDDVAYRPGDSWLVVAATAVGKTAFLLTLQASLDKRNVPSMFATLEQPWVQLMDRQMAAMAEIDGWKIARGDLTPADFGTLSEKLGEYSTRPSIMVDEPSLTTARLETYLRIAKVKYGTKICFVDYAQRMTDKDGDSEYLRVSRISNNLARIARELRICMVSAAQVNRKGAASEGEPPHLHEIRDSGYLEQDASVVLALGRKEGAIETLLAIRKNRHGAAGLTKDLMFDREHLRFLERA